MKVWQQCCLQLHQLSSHPPTPPLWQPVVQYKCDRSATEPEVFGSTIWQLTWESWDCLLSLYCCWQLDKVQEQIHQTILTPCHCWHIHYKYVCCTVMASCIDYVLIQWLLFSADDTEVQRWTCGYRGLCRKHCYAQEYMIGYHGCPRRHRFFFSSCSGA